MECLKIYNQTIEKNLWMKPLKNICKTNKFYPRNPYDPQSQGWVKAFSKYIQNTLYSLRISEEGRV